MLGTVTGAIASIEAVAAYVRPDTAKMKENLKALCQDILNLGSYVRDFFTNAKVEWTEANDAAKTWLENAGSVLSTIANAIKSLQDIAGWKTLTADVKALAKDITDLLNEVGRAILDAVKNATTSTVWGDAEIAAKTWLEGAGGVLSTVANAIKGLQDVAGWTGVKANASTLAKNITETLNAVADAILGAIGESRKWDDVKKAAAEWLSGAGGVVSTVANAIKSILDIAAWTGQIEVAENQFRSITPASVASLAESITNFLITVSKAIVDAIQAAKVTWGDAEKAAADWATGASNVISSISSAAKGMEDLAKIDITTSAIATSNVVGGIATAIGWVKAKLETLEPEAVINLCNRAHDILKAIFDLASFKPSEIVDLTVTFDNAKAIGNRAMSGLLFGLTSNMGALAAQVAGVIAALQLPDMYSGGFNAGASLINGIVAGIYAALPNLQAALAYLASLLPHSPAKRGPLSEPVGWAGYLGAGLPQALAGLQQTLGGLAPTLIPAPALIGGGGPGYAPAMAAPTTGGNTMVNLNFAGMNLYGTDEEAARRFGRQIVADLERQGIRIRGR
jgi:cell division septum initiation protein DivIVA